MPTTIKASDGTELDTGVVNLARAIRARESKGNYNAVGDAGTSKGAYQWQPNNFENGAKEYGLDPNDFSPVNQDKVAYHQVKALKDKGYSPEQVAAAWNAGEGSLKNDAWKTNIGVTTIKGQQIRYDTPGYVNAVVEEFKKNKGQAPQMGARTPAPMPDAPMDRIPAQDLAVEGDKSFTQKVAEFAFPILEKKERTVLETLGDIGLSALWFVPVGGIAASAGLRALGVGAKAAKVGGVLAAGAGTGYAADVSQKLSEGEEGAGVLRPGLGTVLGVGTAGLVSRVAGKYTQKGIIGGLVKENNSVFAQTKRGANELAESFSKSKDPGKFLAERGINLKRLIDPSTVKYATTEASEKILQDSSTLNKTLTQSLSKVGGSKPVVELEQELLAKVPKNYPERADIVRREMQLLKQQYGDAPSIADLNEWKHREWGLGKFDMAVPSETRLTYRMIGNHLKTEVETLAAKGGLKDVDKFNEIIGSHLDAADMLEMLHGTAAKGGRLGNLMRESGMQMAGGLTGAFGLGAGAVGMMGGMLVGHYGAKALAMLIRKYEGSPIKSAILRRMEREEPELVKQFTEFAKKTPQALESLKQQLSQQGIDIFQDTAASTPKTLKLVPKPEGRGTVQGLITTMGARVGAGI